MARLMRNPTPDCEPISSATTSPSQDTASDKRSPINRLGSEDGMISLMIC